MKKLLIFLFLFGVIGTSTSIYASPTEKNNITEIVSLVKLVYKQDTRSFLRIEIKEHSSKTIEYYQRFFTPAVSEILVNKLAEAGAIGPFNGLEDPRYCDAIPGDPIDGKDWYKFTRKILKLKLNAPLIQDNHAILAVDIFIKGYPQEYRSVYYLVKTNNGWRISNIKWGPKGEFKQNATLGIQSIVRD